MMYFFWVRHHLRPSDFIQAGYGEKIVLRALFLKEIEEDEKLQKKIGKD